MKVNVAIGGMILSAAVCANAYAFPKMPSYLVDGYKDNKDYKPFIDKVNSLEMKCDVCHKPGADKKGKGHGLNDFGKVYHDRFKPKDFQAADKAMKTDEAMKIFKETWEKSITEKNADGKVYWDLIKEGKLPGKND
jgi:hypothetical protein